MKPQYTSANSNVQYLHYFYNENYLRMPNGKMQKNKLLIVLSAHSLAIPMAITLIITVKKVKFHVISWAHSS